jgi:hypothetical protein
MHGMSGMYGPSDDQESIATIHAALVDTIRATATVASATICLVVVALSLL